MNITSRIVLLVVVASMSFEVLATGGFDRNVALSEFGDECQLNLVLAMGLSAQKQAGEPKSKLKQVASKSKNPEIMLPMVEELFEKPELQGRTYSFYSFDSCLISVATETEPVALDVIRSELIQCEKNNRDMEGLISCIDSTILSHGQDS